MAPAKTSTEGRNWLPLLLPALAVLAGLALWDRQSGGSSAPAVVTAADKSSRAQGAARTEQSVNPLANLSLDKLHDTIGRPLFEKSRRPIVIAAPPPPPPPLPVAPIGPPPIDRNALSLLGVVASPGRTTALINRRATGQNVRVRVGDEVDGWTIVSIEPQRVMIRQGDTQIALQLFRRKALP